MWLFCGHSYSWLCASPSKCLCTVHPFAAVGEQCLARPPGQKKKEGKKRIAAGRAISLPGDAAMHGQPFRLAGGESLLQCFCFGLHITFIAGLLQNQEGRVNCRAAHRFSAETLPFW